MHNIYMREPGGERGGVIFKITVYTWYSSSIILLLLIIITTTLLCYYYNNYIILLLYKKKIADIIYWLISHTQKRNRLVGFNRCSSSRMLPSKPQWLIPILLAMILRLLMMYLAMIIDSHPQLQISYTDIDYHIFEDAAFLIMNGLSPFERSTYRYPPLVGFLLTPNFFFISNFGKLVFVFADVLIAFEIYAIIVTCHQYNYQRTTSDGEAVNESMKKEQLGAWFWALNPLAIIISTRGSVDSISNLLLLFVLHSALKRIPALSGFLLGLLIHIRLYPIIFVPSLLVFFLYSTVDTTSSRVLRNSDINEVQLCWSFKINEAGSRALSYLPSWSNSKNGALFLLMVIISLVTCTLWAYWLYGEPYMQHSIWYHISRNDHRHNFSPHFYGLYLQDAMRNMQFNTIYGDHNDSNSSLNEHVSHLSNTCQRASFQVSQSFFYMLSSSISGNSFPASSIIGDINDSGDEISMCLQALKIQFVKPIISGILGALQRTADIITANILNKLLRDYASLDLNPMLSSIDMIFSLVLPYLPQLIVFAALVIKYATNELPLCLLLTTMVFVSFNRVITAQYFTWYFCLAYIALFSSCDSPSVLPIDKNANNAQPLNIKSNKHYSVKLVNTDDLYKNTSSEWWITTIVYRYKLLSAAIIFWSTVLTLWLNRAYLLEFEGEQTFSSVFSASVMFHIANVFTIGVIILTKSGS